MKTSEGQFLVLVDFMERHGDLLKPMDGAHGRQQAVERWTELVRLLNMDASGQPKTLEKWKKVWSDLKNNTKRKAAKINRAIRGTGGGPACKLVLSDLEQRVLSLVGPVAATGMADVAEVGIELPQTSGLVQPPTHQESPSLLQTQQEEIVMDIQYQDVATGSIDTQFPPGPVQMDEDARAQAVSTPFRTDVEETGGLMSPTSHHVQHGGGTTSQTRRAIRQRQLTPRRNRRRAAVEQDDATTHFLQSDDRWRGLMEKINDSLTRFATESLRLREEELRNRQAEREVQARWQVLFENCTKIMEKFYSK